MDNELKYDLMDFIDENPNYKFQNSMVNTKYYNTILERKQNKKKTNVKSIKSLDKFINYCIASKMLDYDTYSFFDYAEDILSYYEYRKAFRDMFSEIEYETPEIRTLKNPNITFVNNKFYAYDKDVKVELYYDFREPVTYALLDRKPSIGGNCWGTFEYECKKPIGSVNISVSWIVTGTVKLDKSTCKYILSDVRFVANYPVVNHSNYITARYTGLHNSAWVVEGSITGDNRKETVQNRDWDGHPIERGKVYITSSNRQIIASIRGDWDGYYNNISFDKLKDLLEQTV